jgi:hypothetical protein
MAIFRCFIRGENFPFMMDGAWKSVGFYTTRFVEAPSAEAAEEVALLMLQGDQALARDPSTPGLERAQIFFDEIEEVSEAGVPNAGFTFFNEDE